MSIMNVILLNQKVKLQFGGIVVKSYPLTPAADCDCNANNAK